MGRDVAGAALPRCRNAVARLRCMAADTQSGRRRCFWYLRENSRDAAFVDNHLSELRISQHRDNASGGMSILLRLSRLRRTDETKARGLLRVLLIRRCPLPSGPGGARQWRGNSLLSNIEALTQD